MFNEKKDDEENEEQFGGDISSIIIGAPMDENMLKGGQFEDFMEESINLNKEI